ncbi:hypothetical protein L1987_08705 [Smallanthus sonchifolius]|uniref:Uncharacterized protein n=2 Tax=Smallanthus sonchifolius TaxID=185202 RepID=A0ACB9JN68_9ASTR|nr:hypothetical protein L1987_08703 [Smallanthus sonchifolius]KAI3821148.1 hypothetical protein L1987_08705 [Smallanthus sonchifolius]
MLVVRPFVATVVASAALAIFLVVNKTGCWAGYTDGFLTKSQILNIGKLSISSSECLWLFKLLFYKHAKFYPKIRLIFVLFCSSGMIYNVE